MTHSSILFRLEELRDIGTSKFLTTPSFILKLNEAVNAESKSDKVAIAVSIFLKPSSSVLRPANVI